MMKRNVDSMCHEFWLNFMTVASIHDEINPMIVISLHIIALFVIL